MAERWIGRLGGLHQYKGVLYVDIFDDGSVRCNLCRTGCMAEEQRKAHFHGSKHRMYYTHVKTAERERNEAQQKRNVVAYRCSLAATYEERVKQLGCHQWQADVGFSMYQFIQHGGDILPQPKEALQKLERYEHMESLSLLELAIVKTKICDGVFFRTLDDLRDQHVLSNGTFNSSSHVHAMRVKSGCDVIIPNVARFL